METRWLVCRGRVAVSYRETRYEPTSRAICNVSAGDERSIGLIKKLYERS